MEEEETRKRQETMKEKEELKRKREANSSATYLENFKRSKVEVYPKGELQAEELSASAESNVSRIQEDEINTFAKTVGFVTVHGVFYEVKMCMLVFLKLLNLKASFSLCSNLKEAKTFDDVVVHYKYNKDNGNDVNGALFIQLKHAENNGVTRSISFYKGKPYFRLLDFFLSFSISHRIENHDILSCDLDNRYYLIFTNADVDRALLTEDNKFSSILDDITCYGTVLKLKKSDEYEKFKKFIKNLSDIFDDSSKNQRNAAKEINNSINKGEFIVKEEKLSGVSRNRSLEILKYICIKYKDINIKKIDDFLSKMRICCCQANVDMLDHFINNEIQSSLTVSEAETEAVFTKLREKFILWHDRESYYLTQNSKIWADISKSTRDVRLKNMEMSSLGVKFDDVSVSSITDIININRFLNIVSTGETTTLSTLKVWQVIESLIPETYLLVSVKECTKESHDLWNTWPNRWCKTLVIEFDVDCGNDNDQWIKDKLMVSLRADPASKVILITSHKRNFVIENITDVACEIHDVDINFDQLDENSQAQIFETRRVNFQGSMIDLKDILMIKHLKMLDPIQLTNLVKDEFTLGKPTSEYHQEGYISRNIHIPCINKEVFHLSVTKEAFFVIAIESLEPQDFILSKNIYAVEDIIKLKPDDFENAALKGHYYHAYLKNGKEAQEYQTLCQTFSDVHWIKKYDNCFVWKKSQGVINTIKNYLYFSENKIFNEDFLIIDVESPVVISGEPGMGKSSLLKHMVFLLKKKYPCKWVVFIELSQYCEFFKSCDEVGKQKMFEIICHALSETNVSFISQNFENLKNFVLLLDAFDEISPHYTNVVHQFIKYLIDSSCFVYVTCRPSDSLYLEETFSVVSHILQPLDNERQEKLLIQSWKSKGKSNCDIDILQQTTLKSQAKYLIDLNSKHLNDPNRSFTGNPLHILMLSEIYGFANLEVGTTAEHVVNVFQMFTEYMRKTCEVYYMEKMNCNIANSIVKANLDNFMSDIIEINKKVSAAKIFWNELQTNGLEILFSKDKAFYCSIKVGIFKETGSIFPNYMHRLFVEYFAALWLAENYLQNIQLTKDIILHKGSKMIKKFYDLKCSEDNLFHAAILTTDVEYVKNSIEDASILNSKDAMGRTALHLTASSNDLTMTEMLLEHQIEITIKDKIGLTALDYAIYSHSWETLNCILAVYQYTEHEGKQLWETAEPCQNDIIFLCCKKNLTNLLKFICEKVNLNQKFSLPKNENFNFLTTHFSFPYYFFNIHKTYIPLHVAAKYNHIETIKLLQNNECNIEMTDELELSLLHIASSWGHIDLLKYLIKEGLSVNRNSTLSQFYGTGGITPLHLACMGGHTTIIKELVENGANVNYEDSYHYTPILLCCLHCDVDIIQYLVENKADINHCNDDGETAAIIAIKWDNIEVFKHCVAVGKNINHPDQYGNTVLFYVCQDHDLDIVKHCVEKGADLDHVNEKGNTVLFIASKAGRLDIIEYCVEKGAILNHTNRKGNTILFKASKAGRLDIVKYCVEKGADLSRINNRGETALFYAIFCTDSEKDFEIVKYLVGNDADINYVRRDGCTPLMLALCHGKLNIAHYFREREANININHVDNDGNTALMYVATYGNIQTFEYCVKEGANINYINNNGDTALLLSLSRKNIDIANYCLQKGANCNNTNNNGDTPLLIAAKNGYIDVVKYCHKQAADLNYRNNNGHTALYLAIIHKHEEIVQYLRNNGAY